MLQVTLASTSSEIATAVLSYKEEAKRAQHGVRSA